MVYMYIFTDLAVGSASHFSFRAWTDTQHSWLPYRGWEWTCLCRWVCCHCSMWS